MRRHIDASARSESVRCGPGRNRESPQLRDEMARADPESEAAERRVGHYRRADLGTIIPDE